MTRQLTPGQLQQAQGAGGWYVDDSGRNRYVSTGGLRQQGTPMPQPMAPMAPPAPKMQTVAGGSAPQPINTQPGMTQPTNTRPRLTRDMRLGMGNNLNLGKRAPSIGSPTGSAGLTGQPKVPKSPSMMGSGLASSRAGGVKGV